MHIKIENKKFVTEQIIKELKMSLKYNTWNYIALYLETQGYELMGNKYFIEYKKDNNIIDIFWDTSSRNAISIRLNDERILEIRK